MLWAHYYVPTSQKIELPILLAHPVAHPVDSIHTTQMPVYIRKHCLSQSVLCGLIECPPTCFSGYFIHSQNLRKVVVLRCVPNADTVYAYTFFSWFCQSFLEANRRDGRLEDRRVHEAVWLSMERSADELQRMRQYVRAKWRYLLHFSHWAL